MGHILLNPLGLRYNRDSQLDSVHNKRYFHCLEVKCYQQSCNNSLSPSSFQAWWLIRLTRNPSPPLTTMHQTWPAAYWWPHWWQYIVVSRVTSQPKWSLGHLCMSRAIFLQAPLPECRGSKFVTPFQRENIQSRRLRKSEHMHKIPCTKRTCNGRGNRLWCLKEI